MWLAGDRLLTDGQPETDRRCLLCSIYLPKPYIGIQKQEQEQVHRCSPVTGCVGVKSKHRPAKDYLPEPVKMI